MGRGGGTIVIFIHALRPNLRREIMRLRKSLGAIKSQLRYLYRANTLDEVQRVTNEKNGKRKSEGREIFFFGKYLVENRHYACVKSSFR